jgi:hypothetical protein
MPYVGGYDPSGVIWSESWPSGSSPRRMRESRHAEDQYILVHGPIDTRAAFQRLARANDSLTPYSESGSYGAFLPRDEYVSAVLTTDPWDRSVKTMPSGYYESSRGKGVWTRKWVEYWQLGSKPWLFGGKAKPIEGRSYLIVSCLTWHWADGSYETSFVVMVEQGHAVRDWDSHTRHTEVARQLTAQMGEALRATAGRTCSRRQHNSQCRP